MLNIAAMHAKVKKTSARPDLGDDLIAKVVYTGEGNTPKPAGSPANGQTIKHRGHRGARVNRAGGACIRYGFSDTLVSLMLDLNFVRENLPLVEEKLRQRGMDPAAVLRDFREVDTQRRHAITEAETSKAAAQQGFGRNR